MNDLEKAENEYTCNCRTMIAEIPYHAVLHLTEHIKKLENRIKILENGKI